LFGRALPVHVLPNNPERDGDVKIAGILTYED